jgi:hypothetical protein
MQLAPEPQPQHRQQLARSSPGRSNGAGRLGAASPTQPHHNHHKQQPQFQPQGVPALIRSKPARGGGAARASREQQPAEHLYRVSDVAQHQAVIGLASLLGVPTSGAPVGAEGGPAGAAQQEEEGASLPGNSLPGNSTAVAFGADLGAAQWQAALSPGAGGARAGSLGASLGGPAGGGQAWGGEAARSSEGDKLLQRLQIANNDLQERLLASHANYKESQGQIAALKAASRALEAQLLDLRDRLQSAEPALDSAQRQLEARAGEARRAVDIAGEVERERAALEGEAGALREAVAELRRELEAGAWGTGGRDIRIVALHSAGGRGFVRRDIAKSPAI